MTRVRLGIVGCGDIAQIMHLPFLTELKDLFEVRVACDVLPEMAERIASDFQVPIYCTDYSELVARDDIDAVVILSHDHTPVAMAAARAGKHIFVEKPLCYTVEEGRALQKEVEDRGVVLMVGYMKRYDPGYEYAQEIVSAMQGVRLIRVHDFIGEQPITPAEIYTLYRPAPDPARELNNRPTDIKSRFENTLGTDRPDLVNAYGLMLGLASHDMTVLRGLFGDPLRVCYAEVLSGGKMVLAALEYPDEVRCVWEIGIVPHKAGHWFDEELVVYGGAQNVTIRFPNPYVRYLPTSVNIRGLDGAQYKDTTVVASYDEAFRREWCHFYDCVVNGVLPRTGVKDGLRDVELLQEIVLKAK